MYKINNISDKLLAKIPKLAKGEKAVYELVGQSTMDIVATDGTRQKKPVIPATQGIVSRTTIYDGEAGETIEIGYVTKQGTKDKEPTFGNIQFRATNGGRIVVEGGKDHDLYKFLELHPANESNVNPDAVKPSNGYTFRRVKPELTAQEMRKEMRKSLEAAAIVEQATDDEVRTMAQILNMDSTRSIDEIALDLLHVAKENPSLIKNSSFDELVAIKTAIGEGQKTKVIKFDNESNAWRWGDTSEAFMTGFEGLPEEALIKYIQTNEQGEKFYTKLTKAIKAKAKK